MRISINIQKPLTNRYNFYPSRNMKKMKQFFFKFHSATYI